MRYNCFWPLDECSTVGKVECFRRCLFLQLMKLSNHWIGLILLGGRMMCCNTHIFSDNHAIFGWIVSVWFHIYLYSQSKIYTVFFFLLCCFISLAFCNKKGKIQFWWELAASGALYLCLLVLSVLFPLLKYLSLVLIVVCDLKPLSFFLVLSYA